MKGRVTDKNLPSSAPLIMIASSLDNHNILLSSKPLVLLGLT